MFKNKHIIAALIVTPVLAIGAYLIVDNQVGEKPHLAEAGQSYPLVALPNCRYSSGKCTLKNNEFKLDITQAEQGAGVVNIHLSANIPLQAAKMALVTEASAAGEPETMHSLDSSGKEWAIALKGEAEQTSQLRLVAVAGDAFYFGEAGLVFLNYETSYHNDFRHE